MAAKRYVIIGDGAAGTTAAQYLRASDKDATIAILSDDPHAAYFRAALTNYLLGELRSEQIFAVPPSFYEELRIHRALTRVAAVDTQRSQVCLAQGARVPYDALLLASGSRARTPTFDGWWLPGIMTMRTLQDVNRVMDLVKQKSLKSTVLVGGGPLALEWAHGLSHRGVKVTMVVREARFLPGAIDGIASDLLLSRLRRAGVDVYMSDEVVAAMPGQNGKVQGVALKSGQRIACELIAAAIGVVCNSEFLGNTGINLGKHGGIEVDANMRTSVQNVFAAGDVASFGGKLLQLWEPARLQGRVAAATMGGRNAKYVPGAHYMATRLYDLDCASIGDANAAAGANEELVDFPQGTGQISYRKLSLKDGKLVGALMFGEREAHVRRLGRAFKRLIDSQADVRPIKDDLLDPAFDLPAWLNKNELINKPKDEEGGEISPPAEGAQKKKKIMKSMLMTDLPALPQMKGAPKTSVFNPYVHGGLGGATVAGGGPTSSESAGIGAPVSSNFAPPSVALNIADESSSAKVRIDTPKGPVTIHGTGVIGRDPQCAVPLDDPMASSAHAEVSISGQSAYIRDLGSSNGTWVGGVAITMPKKLHNNDIIRVGATDLTVHIEGALDPGQSLGASQAPWQGEAAPHLDVQTGRSFGLSFHLVEGPQPMTIGRDPRASIRLDDEWIDALHASLRKGANGWEIMDAESHGVTKRNGIVLAPNQWVPIVLGDIIEIGYVRLAYTMKQSSLPAQLGAVAGSPLLSHVPAGQHPGMPLHQSYGPQTPNPAMHQTPNPAMMQSHGPMSPHYQQQASMQPQQQYHVQSPNLFQSGGPHMNQQQQQFAQQQAAAAAAAAAHQAALMQSGGPHMRGPMSPPVQGGPPMYGHPFSQQPVMSAAPVTPPSPGAAPPPVSLPENSNPDVITAKKRTHAAQAMPAFAAVPPPGGTRQSAAVPMQQGARGRVRIRSGPGQGSVAELVDMNVVGSLAGQCTLVIGEMQIAPRHVEIARRPDGFYARDLGSQTGTFVRGQRIGGDPFKLANGDVVQLGASVALEVEVST